MDANTARVEEYKKSLDGIDKPLSLDVVPTEQTKQSLADLTEIKHLIDYIKTNQVKLQVESRGWWRGR